MRKTTDNVSHWSKDFVEHLRTVHFALLAVSAGLLVLAISKSDYNARKARIEIEEIARMKSEWSLKWVQERSRTTDSTPIKVILDSNKKLLPNLYAVNRNVAAIIGGIPSFDVAGMSGFLVDPPRGFRPIRIAHPDICFVSAGDWSPYSFPTNLSDFHQWWNGLANGFELTYPYIVRFPESKGGNGHQYGFLKTLPKSLQGKQPDGDPVRDAAMRPEKQIGRTAFNFEVGEIVENGDLIRYTTAEILLSAKTTLNQGDLTTSFHFFRAGSFEENFLDLSIMAKGLEDLPIEKLADIAKEEANKGTEVFEAFGMKFPAGQITFWGIVVLLSVQLYFLVYLRQLFGKLKKTDPGCDVPWVGIDQSLLSQIILFTTIVILPFVAAVMLGWQGGASLSSEHWERTEPWFVFKDPIWSWGWQLIVKIVLLLLAALTSGLLGFLSWKFRPQLTSDETSCPVQYFE